MYSWFCRTKTPTSISIKWNIGWKCRVRRFVVSQSFPDDWDGTSKWHVDTRVTRLHPDTFPTPDLRTDSHFDVRGIEHQIRRRSNVFVWSAFLGVSQWHALRFVIVFSRSDALTTAFQWGLDTAIILIYSHLSNLQFLSSHSNCVG